ncbi:hypothetical protein GCM10008018_25800 [Paenibacillus marchantiophytorum]|uniref:Response regulator n=1 Tax=Paenibacillus marchantiophytorum TaxID=1619310 RepID=A0ABQ1ENL9_9BACL|nr:response regulator [Paenibacillus marchantiophytorum]GFZ79061.1 hypothetical protein GCM10008018_25800 [Paenibacillus marchantiophytorum]
MMRTVLLVEDEPFVRRTLLKQVNWEAIGYQVIGESGNGREALQMLLSQRPDIVITDIMMPEMNGTELLKRAREEGVDSKFIMLTCMNDFEYARQAIEFGASGYILKLSMSIPELEQKLVKLRVELDEKEQYNKIKQQENRAVVQSVYQKVWMNIVNGKEVTDRSLDLDFERVYPYVQIWASASRQAEFPDAAADVEVHRFMDEFQESRFYWHPAPIQIASATNYPNLVSSSLVPTMEWGQAWRKLRGALLEAWYAGEIPYIEPDSRLTDLRWEEEKALLLLLDHGKWSEFRRVLADRWGLYARSRTDYHHVKKAGLVIIGMYQKQFPEASVDQEIVYKASSHAELLRKLDETLENCLTLKRAASVAYTSNRDVNRIIDYIHLNYSEEITVKSLAEYVSYDPHYVSALFKKKKGTTIINYIQLYRVEQAKRLLKDTMLSITEVGERVGFENDNYFIKIFKRFVNMTPNQYRQLR